VITERESPLAAAKREFAEETGHKPSGQARPFGEAKQSGGKIVHEGQSKATGMPAVLRAICWRWIGHQDPDGGRQFPEWFRIHEAHSKILKGQAVFLDRLLETLASS
jgi:predicted NUDIX family NTP pyrophosphohydrolase